MRAVVRKRAGSADHLVLKEVPDPAVGPTDVLVRVRATSVTRGDVVLRRMPRIVTRLVGETPKEILGSEFAGEVESVGGDVTDFDVGDRVFGTTSGLSQGSYAELLAIPEGGLLASIPEGIGYAEAAPVPVAAMTALHFLREGRVVAGERVLVNGASGSVGSFAIQIARHMGAHVTGVASTANIDLVDALGAHATIDYTVADFTEGEDRYDVVFDAAGKTSRKAVGAVLSPGGRFVTTQTRRHESIDELKTVRQLLADGSINAVVDRTYAFHEVADAHRHVEGGQKRGNVVVVVGS